MLEEILKEVYDTSKQLKLIDMKEMTNFLIPHFEVEDWVEEIILDETMDKEGIYNFVSCFVYFCPELLKNNKESIDIPFSSDIERYCLLNFLLVETINHELTHASQNKILHDLCISSLEKDLLQISFAKSNKIQDNVDKVFTTNMPVYVKVLYYKLCLFYNFKLYSNNYIYDPMERFAVLKSKRISCELSKMLIDKYPNLFSIFEYRLLNAKIRPYWIVASPTYHYMYKMGILKALDSLDIWGGSMEQYKKNSMKYSLDERIYYGLPLEKEEILYLKNLQKEKYLELKKSHLIR